MRVIMSLYLYCIEGNKEISFSLTGSTPASGLDLFKINGDTGLLLTSTFLDDTTKGCYLLSIEASNPETELKDTGEANICITDQNESPDFDKSFYNFTIDENEPASESCVHVCVHVCTYSYTCVRFNQNQ